MATSGATERARAFAWAARRRALAGHVGVRLAIYATSRIWPRDQVNGTFSTRLTLGSLRVGTNHDEMPRPVAMIRDLPPTQTARMVRRRAERRLGPRGELAQDPVRAAVYAIATEQLTKHYGRRVGIDDLTLGVPDGSIFGFLGPNGSGKTTTIRILLGLLRPNGGRAYIFSRDCWRASHLVKANVGYLPGDLRLYPWLTGREALRILGRVRRRDLSGSGEELAAVFELDLRVPVRVMSRGMRQKLGLLVALVHAPRLLLLDEPSTALDPIIQGRLFEQLRRRAAEGHTVFFSSHTLGEVEELCDRVAILRNGRLLTCETLADLRARARRQVTLHWRARPPADLALPKQLERVARDGSTWRAELTGPAMDLLRWSVTQPLADLSIEPPDLATLFRQFYQ